MYCPLTSSDCLQLLCVSPGSQKYWSIVVEHLTCRMFKTDQNYPETHSYQKKMLQTVIDPWRAIHDEIVLYCYIMSYWGKSLSLFVSKNLNWFGCVNCIITINIAIIFFTSCWYKTLWLVCLFHSSQPLCRLFIRSKLKRTARVGKVTSR